MIDDLLAADCTHVVRRWKRAFGRRARSRLAAAIARLERGEWVRASGQMTCCCGAEYWRHPEVPGHPWLTRLCGGDLIKS